MPALDAYPALDRRVELDRPHCTPARYLHDAPADRGTSPPVVVRPRHHCEIERVGKADDVVSLLLDRSHALGSAITQLHRIQARESVLLVLGQLREVAGNGENQQRRGTADDDSRIGRGIVPVTLWIERERRVDPDSYDVLVMITRLETREQHSAVAGVRRIA